MTLDRRKWPPLLVEVAARLGDEAALRLAGRIGGQRVSLPRRAEGSEIADRVGLPLARVLCDLRGGESLSIPSFHARLAEERRRLVLTQPERSANDLAEALGITSRRVEQIRAEARVDPRQMDLFRSASG